MEIDNLVRLAQKGDKTALRGVVDAVQDKIYYLAIRMLCHPDDARDATQEILILVITKLSTFQFKSKFSTWVYRVSSNYLLGNKKLLAKLPSISFDDYQQDLESGLVDPADLKADAEYSQLLNEIRISCTIAMLLCLDNKHRIAYILGDIFELDHREASECLSTTKDNFRQQLSRARTKVVEFTRRACGLVSEEASCRCDRKLKAAIKRGRIDPNNILFANKCKTSYSDIRSSILNMSSELRTISQQTAIPSLKNPEHFVEVIEALVSEM